MPTAIEGAYSTVSVHAMTELDAVNMMLSNAGESPVDTLENSTHADAVQSRQVLLDASRDVQLEGWHFNTEHGVTLAVAKPTPGKIPVPVNALRVDVSPHTGKVGDYLNHDIIQRGSYLYDLTEHTDKFDHDITVTIVYLLPFEQLPEAARYYIAIKASRRFRQMIDGGDDGMGSLSQQDELRARNTLMREDSKGLDAGFLSPRNNTLIGHDLGRVLRRRL